MTGGVTGGSVAAAILAAYLVVGLPASGLLVGGELRRRLAHDGAQRLSLYRHAISRQWVLAGIAVGVAGLAATPPSALGVQGPRLLVPGVAGLVAELALLGAAVASVVALARRAGRRRPRMTSALIPVTREERRLYAGVAVTAGVVEELFFWGFLI